LTSALNKKLVIRRLDFIYPTTPRNVVARDRSNLAASERGVEWIPPEELDDAILRCLEHAQRASQQQLVDAVRVMFGFGRRPDGLELLVRKHVKALSDRGAIEAGRVVG